jgi:hypothetical protein
MMLEEEKKKTSLAKLSNKIAITNEFLFHHFIFSSKNSFLKKMGKKFLSLCTQLYHSTLKTL